MPGGQQQSGSSRFIRKRAFGLEKEVVAKGVYSGCDREAAAGENEAAAESVEEKMEVVAAFVEDAAQHFSWTKSRPHQAQLRQAVRIRLVRSPADTAQNKNAVERIIEGPSVVPGDAAQDPAEPLFPAPQLRAGFLVLHGGAEDGEVADIAMEAPVTFVDEVNGCIEPGGDGMAHGGEGEIHHPMAEGGK